MYNSTNIVSLFSHKYNYASDTYVFNTFLNHLWKLYWELMVRLNSDITFAILFLQSKVPRPRPRRCQIFALARNRNAITDSQKPLPRRCNSRVASSAELTIGPSHRKYSQHINSANDNRPVLRTHKTTNLSWSPFFNCTAIALCFFASFFNFETKPKRCVAAFIVLLSPGSLVIQQELRMPPRNYGTLFIFGNKVCF